MSKTIADIAREAGVSISTVSRVMNNTKPVSPELRERVFKVIDEHHFKPNALAQGLITKKTHMIGVIVPDISNAVFGALTKGINSICAAKGYTIMVCESGGCKEEEINLLNILEEKRIDGVLFAGVDIDEDLLAVMQSKDYPVVLVTQESAVEGMVMDTVTHDNVKAMYDAVTFLLDCGHRKIAYIGGPRHDYSSGKKRLWGYKKALEENEISLDDNYIVQGEFSFSAGYEGMKKIYEESLILPTAIVTGSDVIAIGALQFLQSMGIKVPEDVSIVGFDDLEFVTYFKPELTTVRIPYHEEGTKAAKELLKFIHNDKEVARVHYVPHKIVRRGTVRVVK